MSKAANQAKTRWNAKKYTQVKFAVSPEIASAFRAACHRADISMASVISRFMAEYSNTAEISKPTCGEQVSTRRKRRNMVNAVIKKLEQIIDAEEGYKDRIPENLQGSSRYESAEESVMLMGEALELLERVY